MYSLIFPYQGNIVYFYSLLSLFYKYEKTSSCSPCCPPCIMQHGCKPKQLWRQPIRCGKFRRYCYYHSEQWGSWTDHDSQLYSSWHERDRNDHRDNNRISRKRKWNIYVRNDLCSDRRKSWSWSKHSLRWGSHVSHPRIWGWTQGTQSRR